MKIIVQKFGGTSLATIEKFQAAAKFVKKELDLGNHVLVVVSAMAGETNRLDSLCKSIDSLPSASEYDVVISCGEQISSGLMALTLKSLNIKAKSWQAWQLPIITDNLHSKAKIKNIVTKELKSFIKSGSVAVIPGFQGISENSRITTIGRGGSDTSAVMLAAAINADRCDIYTDVDGIYTADPRIVKNAKKIEYASYEEMFELSSLGAKVLQTSSVEIAMRYGVKVQVLSSISGSNGSILISEDKIMEKKIVSGVTLSRNEARLTLVGLADKPGISAKIFAPLTKANINVDMIVQSGSESGEKINYTFTVPRSEIEVAVSAMKCIQKEVEFDRVSVQKTIAKVSIVGLGMKTHSGVAQKMFSALAEKNINIHVISTSEIKISILVDEDKSELALKTLHTAFDLEKL